MEVIDALPQYLRDASALPWRELKLIPVGDIQYGSPGTDVERLKRHLAWGIDNDAYFLGMGDYHDFLSPSNRRYLRNAGLYDTAQDLIEEWYMRHLEELKEILRPTRGRWLGLLEGHHFFEFSDGSTTDMELCRFLEAPFLGTSAILRLPFREKSLKWAADCFIYCHHGQGGGMDPFRRLMQVAPGFPQVHLFLQGHNTSLGVRKTEVIEFYGHVGHLKMRARTQKFVVTGGFMRGYQHGSRLGKRGRPQGSYVEKGMMRPTAVGGPVIYIKPVKRTNSTDIEITTAV